MKTIFKKGMVVYDQMFFPDVEGKIIEIHDKYDKIQIEVKFFSKYRLEPLCMQSSVFYTENGNMINFLGYNCGTSTLSTSPYKLEMQGFEQKAPTPTYEEAEEWIRKEYAKGSLCLMMRDVFEALEALRKLIILRDYYNEGWQPDWSNSIKLKYIIKVSGKEIVIDNTYNISRTMSFKSKEIRDKFLKEQKELLEIAKPLL